MMFVFILQHCKLKRW